jgi:FAD-linked sulfhydryl oxidase
MPVAPGPSRRFLAILITVSAVLSFTFVFSFRSHGVRVHQPADLLRVGHVEEATLKGHVIAPKLGNETAKYLPPLLSQ